MLHYKLSLYLRMFEIPRCVLEWSDFIFENMNFEKP
jgi:hypothetical protein